MSPLAQIFSDQFWFPALQGAFLLAFVTAFYRDHVAARVSRWRGLSTVDATVGRGDRSMAINTEFIGFAIVATALINQTALQNNDELKRHSVFFNVLDIGILLYLWGSQCAHGWIIRLHRRFSGRKP